MMSKLRVLYASLGMVVLFLAIESTKMISWLDLRLIFSDHTQVFIYSVLLGIGIAIGVLFGLKKNQKVYKVVEAFLISSNLFLFYIVLGGGSFIYFLILLFIVSLITFLDYKEKLIDTQFFVKIGLGGLFITIFFSIIHYFFVETAYSIYQWSQIIFSVTGLLFPIFLFPKLYKYYLIILTLTLFSFSVSQLFHVYMYDALMPQSAYFVMMETNTSEGLEFVATYGEFKFFALLFIILLIPFGIIYKLPKYEETQVENAFINQGRIIGASLVIFLSIFHNSYKKSLIYAYYENVSIYKTQLAEFRNEMKKRANSENVFTDLVEINPTTDQQTYIFIIGESTGRSHMSLYNYYRQTNPLLEQKKEELYLFQDVVSPHSHTQPTLEKVLSFANHDDMSPLYKEGTLIDLMNKGGFKTYWLSNQYFSGEWNETVVSAIAKQSDWYLFVNDPKIQKNISYDGRLLKPLANILKEKQQKKFIVLHLLGTHTEYQNRYPHVSDYEKFTDVKTVKDKPFMTNEGRVVTNEYDNAVVYNDYIISTIIDMAKAQNDNSYVLYFSDHGEEVYDVQAMMSHQEANATTTMFEIPFLLWTSDKYKTHNPSVTKEIEKSLTKKYQTDDVIHTLAQLSNLSLSRLDSKKSIISSSFQAHDRWMNGKNYDSLKANNIVSGATIEKKLETYGDMELERKVGELCADLSSVIEIEGKAKERGETFEKVLYEDARYFLNKDFPDGYAPRRMYTYEDLKNKVEELKNDPSLVAIIEGKAEQRGETFEKVLYEDACYFLGRQFPDGYINQKRTYTDEDLKKKVEELKNDPSSSAIIEGKSEERGQSFEQVLYEDARYFLNKDFPDGYAPRRMYTDEDLKKKIEALQSNQPLVSIIERKAEQRGETFEKVLYDNARYLLGKQFPDGYQK